MDYYETLDSVVTFSGLPFFRGLITTEYPKVSQTDFRPAFLGQEILEKFFMDHLHRPIDNWPLELVWKIGEVAQGLMQSERQYFSKVNAFLSFVHWISELLIWPYALLQKDC